MSEMSPVLHARNEYGTPVSVHVCSRCGRWFSVCPPVRPDEWGEDCLAEDCASYDLTRDADSFFEAWPVGRDDG